LLTWSIAAGHSEEGIALIFAAHNKTGYFVVAATIDKELRYTPSFSLARSMA